MKYYLHDEDERHGPFSHEELKSKVITKSTLVWREGLKDWTKGESIEGLSTIFVSAPPPLKKDKRVPPQKVNWARLTLFFLILFFIIAWLTNPNIDQHRSVASAEFGKKLEQIKNEVNPKKKVWKILKEVSFTLSSGFMQDQINQRIISDDYLICSLTKVKLKHRDITVGFGAFGNVWLFTDLLKGISPEELIN